MTRAQKFLQRNLIWRMFVFNGVYDAALAVWHGDWIFLAISPLWLVGALLFYVSRDWV